MKNQTSAAQNFNYPGCNPNPETVAPYIYTEEDLGEGILDADVSLYYANCNG
jgi:hypothetical protein